MFQIAPIAFIGRERTEAGQNGNHPWFSTERQLPAPRRIVLYQTATAQRLGYIDESQTWRHIDGQSESEAVVSWIIANRSARPKR